MKACCLIRDQPHYRADAFRAGLRAIGATPAGERECDVLVIWNRYGVFAEAADRAERRGAVVLVVENGYLGNEFAGDRWYAISVGQHNGAGWWPSGGPERWDSLGIELAPFRADGREVVLLPQRGIGPPGVAMPSRWARDAMARVTKKMKVPARVREHPGLRDSVPLDHDLRDAFAAVTWGSGAALKALAMGVPVFYDMPNWIGARAATTLDCSIRAPLRDEAQRLGMFRRMIWAQWRLSEIESGDAFDRLLND